MAKIVDPDNLVRNTEIVFDTTNKTIQLLVAGNLNDTSPGTTSGVTLQAVYSKCKELWKDETDLNKLKFPFDAITEAKMDLVNSWTWKDAQTRQLIRDGGWSQRNSAGLSMEEYATIISLGSFAEVTDQATFQGIVGFAQSVANFDKTGVLNEAIRTFAEGSAPAGGIPIDVVAAARTFTRTDAGSFVTDGFVVGQTVVFRGFTASGGANNQTKVIESVTAPVITVTSGAGLTNETGDGDEQVFFEFRDFLKAYLRVAPGDPVDPKLYAQYNLLSEQGLAALDYTVYRLPLANAADIKITQTDAFIDANAPYTGMTIDYKKGTKFSTWANGIVYIIGDVVQELTGTPKRWFRATSAGTSSGTDVQDDIGVTWVAFPGERLIGANWYAFNRIIDGNLGTAEQIYEFAQRELRRATNINDNVGGDGFGTVNGTVAVPLLGFLGETLQTNGGLYIDDFDPNDTNRIEFFDITVDGGGVDSESKPVTTTKRTFPFVAAGTIVFNQDILDDSVAKFRMYFDSVPSGDYDTVDAVVVQDNDALPIEGTNPAGDVAFTFDYDGNAQGGRTPGTPAVVDIVAIGLDGAQFVVAQFTITRATGLTFPVNAAKERNYSNP